MHEPRRLLLIRPSALGDVARTVPVVAALKRLWPAAAIDWMVQDGFEDVVRGHPALSGIVPFPRARLGHALRRADAATVLRWCGEVRGRGYDAVIDAQGLLRSALIARATGARVIVGHADAREGAPSLYTQRVPTDAVHTVDRMMSLVEALGAPSDRDMRLFPPPEAGAASPSVVLAPTSRWASKRWPIERWTELCARLLAAGVERIAVVGGPGEREQCGPLLALAARDGRVLDFVGAHRVAGLCAVIAAARLVVANDSAAAHIAVGFGRPLVALYGPTDAARVGPYRREDDVIQHVEPGDRLDHKRDESVRLMHRISVEEVEKACAARLLASLR